MHPCVPLPCTHARPQPPPTTSHNRRQVADNLLANINRAYESQDMLQQIFAAGSGSDGRSLRDPLGMGTIDPMELRLIGDGEKQDSLPMVGWTAVGGLGCRSRGRGDQVSGTRT
jgi:hypothetical protein